MDRLIRIYNTHKWTRALIGVGLGAGTLLAASANMKWW